MRACRCFSFYNFAPPAATGLSDRFALIAGGLCRAVVAHIGRDRMAGPLIVLIWSRLQRMASRFASLAARAGTLRRPPATPGWLIRPVPEAAAYGGQLQQQLSKPEMAALIEAVPQARRILRPLCRMLAIPPAPAGRRRTGRLIRLGRRPWSGADGAAFACRHCSDPCPGERAALRHAHEVACTNKQQRTSAGPSWSAWS